ncbi:hypothetical protein BDD12DRAFT_938392, partial [Trichophaea hybrida]
PLPSGTVNLTPTRRLLQLHGPDAQKFLHALTTGNINTLSPGAATYTAFLSPQGRVLFDTFIYHPDVSTFLIEADASLLPTLEQHLKRYKLRSKFTLHRPEDLSVWASWGTPTSPPNSELSTPDPRAPGLGTRHLVASSTHAGEEGEGEGYKLRRYLHGVAEGAEEIPTGAALPLEYNMDFFGAVDFHKGCYVGQELTIRTKHTGVVRKRVLPVVVYREGKEPGGLEFRPEEGVGVEKGAGIKKVMGGKRAVGKWIGGVGNVGLAVCRIEAMTKVRLGGEAEGLGWKEGDEFMIDGVEEGVRVKAFVPEWMKLE